MGARVVGLLVLGCSLSVGTSACWDRDTPPAPTPPAPTPSGPAPFASQAVSAERTAEASAIETPVEKQLRTAPITFARASRESPHRFDAKLDDNGDTLPVRVELAPFDAPRGYRGAIAFYRLSRALELPLVPAAVERSISGGRWSEALQRDVGEPMAPRVVLPDGTLDAGVFAIGVEATGYHRRGEGRRIDMKSSVEVGIWSKWAASLEPAVDEDPALLRAFVGALVLDYLAGNVLRSSVWLDEDAHALVLDENVTALPPHPETDAVRRSLDRIRAVRRFPRQLPGALEALDAHRIRQILAPGPFDTWLVTPRTRIELLERVRTLASLIAARVERDGSAVTTL